MAKIVSKLNLNKTPSIVENNSLIFAKNIRLDVDETIHKDYGIRAIGCDYTDNTRFNGFLNKVQHDTLNEIDNNTNSELKEDYQHLYNTHILPLVDIDSLDYEGTLISNVINIVGHIENNNEFYIFLYQQFVYEVNDTVNNGQTIKAKKHYGNSLIICYDEKTDKALPCNCNWNYSNGTITGNVITNIIGDKILTVAETGGTNNVPLKHINLSKSIYSDDESIYTQTPNIPISNLKYNGKFAYTIPCGVYQFFIRYKIRDEFYTNWFPASRELFAGNRQEVNTILGTVGYSNANTDADKSFIFTVQHLNSNLTNLYESFQIGFILSHDDAVYARAWKHFTFNENTINFDYKADDSTEIEVTELLNISYQLYNVGNVTSFKNKLYISNYLETNFSPDLQSYADNIKINLAKQEANEGYGDFQVEYKTIANAKYISAFIVDGQSFPIGGGEGSVVEALFTYDLDGNPSIYSILDDINNDDNNNTLYRSINEFGIRLSISGNTIKYSKNQIKKDDFIEGPKFEEGNLIRAIYVNDVKQSYTDIDELLKYLCNKTLYINENGKFVDSTGSVNSSFVINISRTYTYKKQVLIEDDNVNGGFTPVNPGIDINPGTNTGTIGGHFEIKEFSGIYTQTIKIFIDGDKSLVNINNTDGLIDYTTLIPYQKYKFYIHYVTQTGEITNGYYCGGDEAGEIEVGYQSDCISTIYPVFSNIDIPTGYVSCFFSIFHSAVESATVFGLSNVVNSVGDVIAVDGYCLDINARLIPFGNSVNIAQTLTKTGDVVIPGGTIKPINPPILESDADESTEYRKYVSGTYHNSSDPSSTRYFGACGLISVTKDSGIDTSAYAYSITDYKSQQIKDVQLIKCTPFINEEMLVEDSNFGNNTYNNYEDLNLCGYVAQVYMLSKDRTTTIYTDGATIHQKSGAYNLEQGENSTLEFKEYYEYQGGANPWIGDIVSLVATPKYTVYSNYNLNFIMLDPDVKPIIKTYYATTEDNTDKSKYERSAMMKVLESLTLSEIYRLPSMYKSYTRKTYSPYIKDNSNIVLFNNTIRCSELIGDESSINIFKFNANDYYNVPTNRGIIVNLMSVGDSILVHNQDSIFRFSGSNTIQSSDGEIQPTESTPFETGIAEVFGSDFGFAGLQNKKDSITTESGYVFFDRDSRIIYMYSGQGQLVKISDSIEKLFRYKDIVDVNFANDYYHNRFFLNIKFKGDTFVTLSYSFLTNIKSFVSLHDFSFADAFNTKTKCYFLPSLMYNLVTNRNTYPNICTIDESQTFTYDVLGNYFENDLYLKNTTNNDINFANPYDNSNISINLNSFYSIIDVIYNAVYENVKTLNSISWCSSYVESEIKPYDSEDFDTIKLADVVQYQKPCDSLRIYSDTCCGEIIKCDNISNNLSINNPDNYKYPRYNNGKWSLNYFRDIENTEDRYNYLKKYNDGRELAVLRSDNNSLIEGKYFVVRFVFKDNFKLETLIFSVSNKI